MYYANKIAAWVLSPIGLLFCGLITGALLRRFGRSGLRRMGALLMLVDLALFWILGCSLTTRLIGPPLEGDERAEEDVARTLGDVDALVLLGGGIGCHEQCERPELFLGADRAWTAARLWKALRPRDVALVLSGGGAEESTVPLLRDLGVTTQNLHTFPEARNTEEEAHMIAAAGLRRIGLVTSAWHMPRARMLFARAGLDVVEAPTDYEMHFVKELPLEVGDFFPSADALNRNSLAVKEWVARALYALRFGCGARTAQAHTP